GSVAFRLRGDGRNDWDLALFDSATGRRLDSSMAWGANEVVQTLVRAGQSLTIQACRLSGSSAREPLEIDSVAVPLATGPVKAPTASLVQIPIGSGLDVSLLTGLGLNLNEASEGHSVSAVLNGPADAARLRGAGFTYRTL